MKFQPLLPNLLQFIVSIILWFKMSAIVTINEWVCLGRGRGQFSVGVVLVIKRFHRESNILVDPLSLSEPEGTVAICDPILENNPYRGIFEFWVMHIGT